MAVLNGTIADEGSQITSYYRIPDDATSIVVKSGDLSTTPTPNPLAGFSCWFVNLDVCGMVGPPGVTMSFYMDSVDAGSPICGLCFNVTPTSTVGNFTGYAMLANTRDSKAQIVRYVDADLRTDAPTVLAENAFTFDGGRLHFYLDNFPDDTWGHYFWGEFFQDGDSQDWTQSDDPGGYAASDATAGFGFIWVGNPDLGNHQATLIYDSANAWVTSWYFVTGESFRFLASQIELEVPGPTYGVPIATTLNDFNRWRNQAGSSTNIWQAINRTYDATDATWIRSIWPINDTLGTAPYVCKLSDVGTPGGGAQVLRIRASKSNASTPALSITAELRQGYVSEASKGTLICTITNTDLANGFAAYEHTLSGAEISAITNYADLYVRIEGFTS